MKRAMHAGKRFFAPTLTAIIALAISFTFLSCSGDGEDDSSPGVSSKAPDCSEWETKTAPTCESEGEETRVCDGEPQTRSMRSLFWNGWETTPATCDAAGERKRSCPGNASPAQTEAIPKLGWKLTKAPTCGANGEERKCGSDETRVIDKIAYDSDTHFCLNNRLVPKEKPRDAAGREYEAVLIGDQVWMAENLAFEAEGSACYDNDPDNCAKYGRLYDWATAMDLPDCNSESCSGQIEEPHQGICPDGWHIPSDDDWETLSDYVEYPEGTKLKATSGWNSGGNGLDIYGFTALPGGYYGNSGGLFDRIGNYGYWWSTTESAASRAYYRRMIRNNEGVEHYDNPKADLFSVRCLQD